MSQQLKMVKVKKREQKKEEYLGETEGREDIIIEIYIVTSCSNIGIKIRGRFFDPKRKAKKWERRQSN